MSDVRQLLGDLAVASLELVQAPAPPYQVSIVATFDDWYGRTESWLRLAIATGVAAHAQPDEVTPELVELVAASFGETTALSGLVHAVEARFDYLGYEEGYLYGAIAWEELCVARSALALVADLLEDHEALCAQLDMASLDERMAHWGFELFEPLEVPSGIPADHWWWFRDRP